MLKKEQKMNTEKRFGLKKSKAIMLFIQMFLIIFLLIISIYLLIFVISNKLGGWMISSYIFITLSILAIICYSIIGYKKAAFAYYLAIIPFLVAILINVILPNRETFQIALLAVLLALTFGFMLRQNDHKFTYIIGISMIVISLVFSIYSSIKADTQFLGDISKEWPTYVAMYSSIFIPVVVSSAFVLTYSVRISRNK